MEQLADLVERGKTSAKNLWNPSAGTKDHIRNRTLKLIGIKRMMFILASALIIVLILSSQL
jgi:hypothetical protein